MKAALAGVEKRKNGGGENYPERMLTHIIDVLEKRELPLVYPDAKEAR